jgi:hypothetical protein
MLISTILLAAEDMGPNPIAPEGKEFFWGAGTFLVFLFVMRVFLVPKVRKGMALRYGAIREGHESADATRAAAQNDVAAHSLRFEPKSQSELTARVKLSMQSVSQRWQKPMRELRPSEPKLIVHWKLLEQLHVARLPRPSAASPLERPSWCWASPSMPAS